MCLIGLKPAVAVLASMALFAPVSVAGEQRIACPASGGPARAAQAIFVFGSLQEPWGELKDPPQEERKDGSVVHTYLLPGETPAGMPGKWLICYYDGRPHRAVKLHRATKECTILSRREGINPKTKELRYLVQGIRCE